MSSKLEAGQHSPRFSALLKQAESAQNMRVALAYPLDEISLQVASELKRMGNFTPYLVGPRDDITNLAQISGISLENIEIIDAPDPVSSASKAVALVRDGSADGVMKGSLHTDELMAAVVNRAGGLRVSGKRMSHIFVLDVPAYHKFVYVTDAALNIAPDLATKADIAQNAINLAKTIGCKTPKVAVLCAVETVNPKMPSTLEAAALSKMADRGQITGGLVDGPFAFDNAISTKAAQMKKISSPVAGDADILLVPALEAGNMLYKQLVYFANAQAAGIVMGGMAPVILTSRADSLATRVASCVVAQQTLV